MTKTLFEARAVAYAAIILSLIVVAIPLLWVAVSTLVFYGVNFITETAVGIIYSF